MTLASEVRPTLMPTNSALPTGGVILPMHRLYTRIRPNCTVLMPKLWQMGRNSGVKIRMAGVTSMKVPDTSRITFMISRITYLLLVRLSRAAATASGICRKAMTQPRMLETPTRNTTMPDILAESTMIFHRLFRLMER